MTYEKNHEVKQFSRIIEKNNIEFAFVDFVWKTLTNAQKIAVLVKASERFFPDSPLDLKNVILEKSKLNAIIVKYGKPYINYNALDSADSLNVFHQLFKYEYEIKDKAFQEKLKDFKSIYDFSNAKQLKYLSLGHEDYLINIYSQNQKRTLVEMAVELDCPQQIARREADEKALYILETLSYYAPEVEYFAKMYEHEFLMPERHLTQFINETLGEENKRIELYIKLAYNFFKDKYFKNENLEDVIEHFKNTTSKDIFENIDLKKSEELERE